MDVTVIDRNSCHLFQRLPCPVATGISRFRAIATIGPLRLSGLPVWPLWLVVRPYYLVGFKNRVTAVPHLAVSFLGRGRSERMVTAIPQAGLWRRPAERDREGASLP